MAARLAALPVEEDLGRHDLDAIARNYLALPDQVDFSDADLRAVDFVQQGHQSRFTVERRDHPPLLVTLNLPGRHNALNAMAAIAVAMDCGVSDAVIQQALSRFGGVGRRFQHLGEFATGRGQVMLVDDYGHHPTEVLATIRAARAGWPDKRLVLVFQPHRYTRTRDLYEDFVEVLSQVDLLLLLDVYAAGEKPIAGADGRALARSIRQRGHLEPVFATNPEQVPALIEQARDAGGATFQVLSYEEIAAGKLEGSFDAVVCNFSLIGKEAVDGLVVRVPRLLNPGGALLIQTLHPLVACGAHPYVAGWRPGSWDGFGPEFTDPAPWYFRTLQDWLRLIDSSGLQLRELREPLHPRTGKPASALFIAERGVVR